MPEDMKERIFINCIMEMEEDTMTKNRTDKKIKRTITAAASLALILCLTGVTALAASGKLQGYFRDIVRFDGAVTGTAYEQATDEIHVKVTCENDKLMILAEVEDPTAAPYAFIDNLEISSYRIVDASGKEVISGASGECAELAEGKAVLEIPADALDNGNYRLIIEQIVGSAKAEQPLVISGEWVCEFTR